jgi:uncharacterized protein YjbI with pentapeptide repeats
MGVAPRGTSDQSASRLTGRRRRFRRPEAPAQPGWRKVLSAVGQRLPAATTVTALIGLLFTAVKLNEDHQSAQRQLANSTFTQAISALGADQPNAVVVGGLYALEQIANESERDHWRAIQIVATHLREGRTPATPLPSERCLPPDGMSGVGYSTDEEVALAVLVGRNVAWERDKHLDLSLLDLRDAALTGVDFAHADLVQTHFEGAILSEADLDDANLTGAFLCGADLSGAHLERAVLTSAMLGGGANLSDAHLARAKLQRADLSLTTLTEADLRGADMRRADIAGANLTGANLIGADLRDIEGMSQDQLDTAITDETTRISPGFTVSTETESSPATP